jgi:hypothetical protein
MSFFSTRAGTIVVLICLAILGAAFGVVFHYVYF